MLIRPGLFGSDDVAAEIVLAERKVRDVVAEGRTVLFADRRAMVAFGGGLGDVQPGGAVSLLATSRVEPGVGDEGRRHSARRGKDRIKGRLGRQKALPD